MSDKRKGQCFCGAVKFEITLKSHDMHVCHCSMCQRMLGGPAFAVECETDFTIDDPEHHMTWFKSSEWAQRSFCNKCGSSIFYKLEPEVGDMVNVIVTLLEKNDDINVSEHICIESKPHYYDFTDDKPRLTYDEMMARSSG